MDRKKGRSKFIIFSKDHLISYKKYKYLLDAGVLLVRSSVGLVNGQILRGGVEFANSPSQCEAKACCSGLINKQQDNFDQIHSENLCQEEGVSHFPLDIQHKNIFIYGGGASEKSKNLLATLFSPRFTHVCQPSSNLCRDQVPFLRPQGIFRPGVCICVYLKMTLCRY